MTFLAGYGRPSVHLDAPTPAETLDWMVQLTIEGIKDVPIRLFAEQLVRQLHPHDYLSEYAALLNWVRTNIRYTRDPVIIEQLKTPRVIMETGAADCDEMAILIGTFVGTLGGRARYVAGAFKRDSEGPVLSHVWAEAFDPACKGWVVLDPVPGRNVAMMLRRLVDSLAVDVA